MKLEILQREMNSLLLTLHLVPVSEYLRCPELRDPAACCRAWSGGTAETEAGPPSWACPGGGWGRCGPRAGSPGRGAGTRTSPPPPPGPSRHPPRCRCPSRPSPASGEVTNISY